MSLFDSKKKFDKVPKSQNNFDVYKDKSPIN